MGLSPSAIVFLILGAGSAMLSGYFALREIEEINQKLSEHERIEYAFMYPGKMKEIGLTYERLYPQGATNRRHVGFQIAAFAFLGLTAVAAGFLR